MSAANEPFVYIVDDDSAVRESIEALIQSADLPVRIAAFDSGVEFLSALDGDAVGCVLLDVRMPDLSGLEVQAQLKQRDSNLSVVIITGHGDIPMAVETMRAGAFHFVEKPFTEDSLIAIVQNAIAYSQRAQGAWITRRDASARIERLTVREREVLDLLVMDHPNKVIAYEMGISPRTVEVHRARLMDKLQVRSLSELVRLALSIESADTD